MARKYKCPICHKSVDVLPSGNIKEHDNVIQGVKGHCIGSGRKVLPER